MTPNLILTGDPSKMKPFLARFEHGQQTKMEGSVPEHWGFSSPDESTAGEIFVSAEAVGGAAALGLRKDASPLPVQLRYDPLQLAGEKTYVLTFDYLTSGGAGAARLMVKRQQQEKSISVERALTDSQGQWRSISFRLEVRQASEYELQLHCYASGSDKGIFFKNLALTAQ